MSNYKTVAGMAVLPQREARAKIAIESLMGQVDGMEIAWQSLEIPIPDWMNEIATFTPGFNVRATDNSRSDAEKLLCHEKYPGDTIWLGTDDDIEYPPGYVELTKAWLEASGYSLVSWHGRVADTGRIPMTSHYKDSVSFPCLGTVPELMEVDFVGSGVSAFLLGKLRLTEEDFPIYGAADITLSTAAWERAMRSYVLPHPANWLKYDHAAIPIKDTIWGQKHNDDAVITMHANLLLASKARLN